MVSKYMYKNWKREMKPPIFSYISFEEWLNKIIGD
jgi:hypothetical protein